jgi:guanylate kinase
VAIRLSKLHRPDRGGLFVVSGPSGVGKSTLIRGLMDTVPTIGFSVSATTRAPREGEADGVDYYFRTEEAFERLVQAGEFLEHARVYDRRYGTLRGPTEAMLASGRSVLLDIDVQGAGLVRSAIPASVHIMIVPPTIDVLEKRLIGRGKDSAEVIAERMRQVATQLSGCGGYDYLVVNDDLETAQAVFNAVFIATLSRRDRNQRLVDGISQALMKK